MKQPKGSPGWDSKLSNWKIPNSVNLLISFGEEGYIADKQDVLIMLLSTRFQLAEQVKSENDINF
jgi:hypothetical protein